MEHSGIYEYLFNKDMFMGKRSCGGMKND